MTGTPMDAADPKVVTLVASLAAAERELCVRRANAAATASGSSASLWWSEPLRCVAMLLRHGGDGAALVSDALTKTPARAWGALLPSLDAQPTAVVRALRATWAAQLDAMGRGEAVDLTPLPPLPEGRGGDDDSGAAGDAPPSPLALQGEGVRGEVPTKQRALDDARVTARLERIAARGFARGPSAPAKEPDEDPDVPANACWYEVAPDGDGALRLWVVVAPGERLRPFVKVLHLRVGARSHAVRRDNLLRIGARIAVIPSDAPMTWSTGDDENDTDFADELRAMGLPGIPSDRVTVFRLDVSGATQRSAGTLVSPGGIYALLSPPGQAFSEALGGGTDCGDGWTLRTLTLPDVVAGELTEALRALGLTVGRAPLSVAWLGPSPARYDLNAAGALCAVLRPDAPAVVRVESAATMADGWVFVHGPEGLTRHALAPGDRWTLALDGLTAGAYVLEATSPDVTIGPARMLFRVDPEANGRWRVPEPEVLVHGAPYPGWGTAMLDGDTRTFDLRSAPIEIRAAPGTPVTLLYDGVVSWRSAPRFADANGVVDWPRARAELEPYLALAPLCWLWIELGAFGAIILPHSGRPDMATLRGTLRRLLDDGIALRVDAARAPQLLREFWLNETLRALGWVLPAPSSPPGPVLTLRFASGGVGHIRSDPIAVLTVVPPTFERVQWATLPARRAMGAVGGDRHSAVGIVTDVERWWRVNPANNLLPRPVLLRQALDDDEAFEDFLANFSVWGLPT